MNSEMMLKELRYLRNRKIDRVRESQDGDICLHFKGGNFCIFEACQQLKDPPTVLLRVDLEDISAKNLLALDLITAEEMVIQEAERQKRFEEYKKLKTEFGGDE